MKPLLQYITEAFQVNEASLQFNDDRGNATSISKEIVSIVEKSFPSSILDKVDSVEPNGYGLMSTPQNKSREYKTVTLIFKKQIGKSNISSLTIGLIKRTSGPGTGYLAIKGSRDGNHILLDKLPHDSASIEFYDNSEEQLSKLFNETIKPLL